MCLCTFWCHLGDFLMRILHFHSLFLGGAKMRSKVAWHATSSCVYCIFQVWSSISSCVYCISGTPKPPFGAHWVLLGSPFRHVGGAVELLGHPLEPTWCQKHQDEGLNIDFGSSRVSQGVSEGLNGSILGRCSSHVGIFIVRKLCASWL